MDVGSEKMPGSEMRKASEPKGQVFDHRLIQRATLGNLDALVDLEEACFSVPWSRKSFEAELEGNQFSRTFILPHPEYEKNSKVIGYICVWVVFEEIRFLNLAVRQEFCRQGLGRKLIHEVLQLAEDAGCCRGMLEVRKSNVPAINLYEYFNFKAYATRKSYYTNPTEDAILMSLEPLGPTTNERSEGAQNHTR